MADRQRILVVTKFGYLGDSIVATAFLREISRSRPNSEITLLGGPAIPALLAGCPYTKELWGEDQRIGKSIRLSIDLVKRLRHANYDTAYLLNRSLHSAIMALLAGIPNRIGHNTERRGFLLTKSVPYTWSKPDRECALDLARAVGIEPCHNLPELWVSEEERSNAAALLESHGIDPGAFMIGVQPGAHDPYVREWGSIKFAETADRLAAELEARVLLLGSREERPVAEDVANQMKNKPVVLSGETDLRQALAIISLCKLWVGNDGGLLHAAVALGPATVGIFGPTKAARWGYSTEKHRTVTVPTNEIRPHAATIRKCLDAVSVNSVCNAALYALVAKTTAETVT
jgi:heptosyltransferase-2